MTGYLVEVYQDTNPESPTYGETREERRLSSECEVSTDPQWEVCGEWCETVDDGFQSGYKITQYEDVNESSPSYGDTREDRVYDAEECVPDTRDADWVEVIDPIELDDDEIVEGSYCVQIEYLPSGVYGNSGIYHKVEIDANMYSPTYQQIRESDIEDLEKCPKPNTDPIWKEVTRTCNMIMVNNVATFDGTANVTYIDENVYSTTYDTTKIENEVDSVNCPSPILEPIWTVESESCQKDELGSNNGYKTTVYRDTNNASSSYNQTSSVTVYDFDSCPLPSTDANWVLEREICITDLEGYNTGDKVEVFIDNNPYSPSYGEHSSVTYQNSPDCPIPPKEKHWVLKRTLYAFDGVIWSIGNGIVIDSNVMLHNGNFSVVDNIDGYGSFTIYIDMRKNGDTPIFSNVRITKSGCSDIIRAESIDQTTNVVQTFYIYAPNQRICGYNDMNLQYLICFTDDY